MNKGTCKHFSGMGLGGKDRCLAGVNYREHVGGDDLGWCTRAPCIKTRTPGSSIKPNGPIVECDKYEEPTADEIAEYEKERKASVDRMMKAIPLMSEIKVKHQGTNAKGTKPCPVCAGVLHYTHAACNGHVWGKCETEGCLSWME